MNTSVTVYSYSYPPASPKIPHSEEHRLGLSLLCLGLSKLYNLSFSPLSIVSEIKKGKVGKPYLASYPHIHFNISHCRGLVVCAFSPAPLGIDAEAVRAFPSSLLKKALSEKEQAFINTLPADSPDYNRLFFRFWTLKESLAKCTALGITDSLFQVDFQFLNFPALSEISSSQKGFYFYHRDMDREIVLSICSKEPIKKIDFVSVKDL